MHIIAELQQGRFNRGGRYLRKFVALRCFTSVLGVLVDKALLKKLFIASQLHVFFASLAQFQVEETYLQYEAVVLEPRPQV